MTPLGRAALAVFPLTVLTFASPMAASKFISYQDVVVYDEIGPGGGGHITCYNATIYRTYNDGRTQIIVLAEPVCF